LVFKNDGIINIIKSIIRFYISRNNRLTIEIIYHIIDTILISMIVDPRETTISLKSCLNCSKYQRTIGCRDGWDRDYACALQSDGDLSKYPMHSPNLTLSDLEG